MVSDKRSEERINLVFHRDFRCGFGTNACGLFGITVKHQRIGHIALEIGVPLKLVEEPPAFILSGSTERFELIIGFPLFQFINRNVAVKLAYRLPEMPREPEDEERFFAPPELFFSASGSRFISVIVAR